MSFIAVFLFPRDSSRHNVEAHRQMEERVSCCRVSCGCLRKEHLDYALEGLDFDRDREEAG